MMKKKSIKVATLCVSLLVASCVQTLTDGEEGSLYCESVIDATQALTNQVLCKPAAGDGRHFRVEGIDGTPATLGDSTTTSRYFQLGVGYETGKTNSFTSSTAAGNNKLYVGGGRHFSTGSVATWVDFGGDTTQNDADIAYANYFTAAQTICFDIGAGSPPQVTLWVTGVKGADCKLRKTLTAATASLLKANWSSATAVNFSGVSYLRLTGSAAPRLTVPRVVVYATTAL